MVRLKRENQILAKREKVLQKLIKANTNKILWNTNDHIYEINHKHNLLENLGVNFETNNITMYTIDNNKKKEKKNKRNINLN